jgi:hypothetical protein
MRANALREICTTVEAPVYAAAERVRATFLLPEALAARGALGDLVVPAIEIEEDNLFGAQSARSAAVDMRYAIAVRLNGILR